MKMAAQIDFLQSEMSNEKLSEVVSITKYHQVIYIVKFVVHCE